MQCTINNAIKIPFTSSGLITGLTTFTPIFLLNGNVTTFIPITYTEIGSGLYTINLTPATSGVLSIFIEGALLPEIEIVARTIGSILQDLQDESLGSWVWDKTAGSLEMVRQDGTSLARFNVVDTLSSASRERI